MEKIIKAKIEMETTNCDCEYSTAPFCFHFFSIVSLPYHHHSGPIVDPYVQDIDTLHAQVKVAPIEPMVIFLITLMTLMTLMALMALMTLMALTTL